MPPTDLYSLADELWSARLAGVLVDAPSARAPHFSIEDGYEVGRLLHAKRIASGDTQVGRKLGFTNERMWAGLGLDSPFWSPIYDATVLDASVVALDRLVQPRIEPEIVLGFGEGLAPGASGDEIASAVEWAALGFEIVHCHFADWRMTPADAIADSGLHGVLVVGERVSLEDASADRLREVNVTLSRQDVVVEHATGTAALGGPTDAIGWLLRLPGLDGVRAGEIITTGTLTSAHAIAPGETWRVDADGPVRLGHMELTFE